MFQLRHRLVAIAAAAFGLSACASLSKEVFNNIHEGASKDHLIEVLGQPDSFAPSVRISGATAYYYVRRGERCGFTIQDDVVKLMFCGARPKYVGPAAVVGSVLQGFGQGAMSGSQRQPANCTTNFVGDTAYTNCQ